MKANPKVAEIASQQIDEIRNKKNSAAELKKKDLSKKAREIVVDSEDMNEGGTGCVKMDEDGDEEDGVEKEEEEDGAEEEDKEDDEEK